MNLLLHIVAYDINCQYRLKFNLRTKALWRSLQKLHAVNVLEMNDKRLFPWTIAGVGKFHLAGHKPDCRYKWSFNFLPYSAMMDGEAPERIWSVGNLLGNRTREMNPGHRHDVMNEFYNDQNLRRVHSMGMSPSVRVPLRMLTTPSASTLTKKHLIAQDYLPPVIEALKELEEAIVKNYGEDILDRLKAKERVFKRDVVHPERHENLENPYDLPAVTGRWL